MKIEEDRKGYVLKVETGKFNVIGMPVKMMASPKISSSKKRTTSKLWRYLMDEYSLAIDDDQIEPLDFTAHIAGKYVYQGKNSQIADFLITKLVLEDNGKLFYMDYEWCGVTHSITFSHIRKYVNARNKGILRMKGIS